MKGQMLIEVLLALGFGALVLLAIANAVIGGLSNTQLASSQNQATLFAQQALEIVRDIKNKSSWSSFVGTYATPSPRTFCLPENDTTPNSGSCQAQDRIDGFFKREIVFALVNSNSSKIRVTVTVSFTDNKGVHKSELISVFTDWKEQ